MKKNMTFLIALLIMFPLVWAYAADVPFLMNFQGSVKTSGGTPYNGNGYFKFAIVDPAGTTAYWSNDSVTLDGSEPNFGLSGIPVAVSNGLFSVRLGDTAFTNMSSMSSAVFDNTSTYVRTWFSDDNASFTQLSPDQRIASGAYAIKAQNTVGAKRVSLTTTASFTSTTTNIGSLTLNLPGPGMIVFHASGLMSFRAHTFGLRDEASCGISLSNNLIPPTNAKLLVPSQMPTQAGLSSGVPLGLTQTYTVSASGDFTGYLNCVIVTGGGGSTAFTQYVELSAIYVPVQY